MSKRNHKKKAKGDTPTDMEAKTNDGNTAAENTANTTEAKEIPIEQASEKETEIPVEHVDADSKKSKKKASAQSIIEVLQEELEKTQTKLKEAEAYNLRLNADFANMRKRKDKEMADLVKYANVDLLKQLLPVFDDFERMLAAMEKSDNLAAIQEGILGVNRHMQQIFGKIGLEKMETKGEEFNSEFHEAVTTISVPDDAQKGKVIDEIETGYKLKEKIIRFSKVIVGE